MLYVENIFHFKCHSCPAGTMNYNINGLKTINFEFCKKNLHFRPTQVVTLTNFVNISGLVQTSCHISHGISAQCLAADMMCCINSNMEDPRDGNKFVRNCVCPELSSFKGKALNDSSVKCKTLLYLQFCLVIQIRIL